MYIICVVVVCLSRFLYVSFQFHGYSWCRRRLAWLLQCACLGPEDACWQDWYLKSKFSVAFLPKKLHVWSYFFLNALLRPTQHMSTFTVLILLLSYTSIWKCIPRNVERLKLRVQGPFRSELCVPCWHSDVGGMFEQNTMEYHHYQTDSNWFHVSSLW